jgi:hypothetical protein
MANASSVPNSPLGGLPASRWGGGIPSYLRGSNFPDVQGFPGFPGYQTVAPSPTPGPPPVGPPSINAPPPVPNGGLTLPPDLPSNSATSAMPGQAPPGSAPPTMLGQQAPPSSGGNLLGAALASSNGIAGGPVQPGGLTLPPNLPSNPTQGFPGFPGWTPPPSWSQTQPSPPAPGGAISARPPPGINWY